MVAHLNYTDTWLFFYKSMLVTGTYVFDVYFALIFRQFTKMIENQPTDRPYFSAIPGRVSSFWTKCFTYRSGEAAEDGVFVVVPYFC